MSLPDTAPSADLPSRREALAVLAAVLPPVPAAGEREDPSREPPPLDRTDPALTRELWAALGHPESTRPFSCAELTCLLPGKIDTPERTYYGILIWSEGIFELKYESMSIKGYRPEPYRHLWKFIYPRPIQQPTEVLCKGKMLFHLLTEGYLTPAAALCRLNRQFPPAARLSESGAGETAREQEQES